MQRFLCAALNPEKENTKIARPLSVKYGTRNSSSAIIQSLQRHVYRSSSTKTPGRYANTNTVERNVNPFPRFITLVIRLRSVFPKKDLMNKDKLKRVIIHAKNRDSSRE